MEMPQVEDLTGYWAELPPVHELVAAYLGVKPSFPREHTNGAREMTPDEMKLMADQLNGLM